MPVLAPGAVAADETAADSRLAAYWPMDEGTGTTAADASGNGNDGMLSAGIPSWSEPYIGSSSLRLGTPEERMVVPEPASLHALSGTNRLTIAFWIKYGSDSAYQQLFGMSDFSVHVTEDGWLQLRYGGDEFLTPPLLSPDEWHHVAIRIDGAAVDFVADGRIGASYSFSDPDYLFKLQGDFSFGNIYDTSPRLLYYDDFRIYDEPLSDEEIASLAAMFNPESEPRPLQCCRRWG